MPMSEILRARMRACAHACVRAGAHVDGGGAKELGHLVLPRRGLGALAEEVNAVRLTHVLTHATRNAPRVAGALSSRRP